MSAPADPAAVAGAAAGVPFVALPPAGGPRTDAPVVLAWHLLDAPRTEVAFAAAVPLAGLDAWRVYFGLPMTGARMVEGGSDELMRLVFADPVLNVHRPVVAGAFEEFPAAFAALRQQLDMGCGPVGVMGGSLGAAVAQLVLIEGGIEVRAAVLLNPVVRHRDTLDALSRHHGVDYTWGEPASEFAARLDFIARGGEMAGLSPRPAVLVVTGQNDLDDAIRTPAAAYVTELGRLGVETASHTVPGMGHALAAEPGVEPAPQLPTAAETDRVAVDWFTKHLQ